MAKRIKQKSYKYKNYFIFKVENGTLNLDKPEYYEGTFIGKRKPTINDKDLPNREIPLHKDEVKEIKKYFSEKEQRRILGYTIKEFKAKQGDTNTHTPQK